MAKVKTTIIQNQKVLLKLIFKEGEYYYYIQSIWDKPNIILFNRTYFSNFNGDDNNGTNFKRKYYKDKKGFYFRVCKKTKKIYFAIFLKNT